MTIFIKLFPYLLIISNVVYSYCPKDTFPNFNRNACFKVFFKIHFHIAEVICRAYMGQLASIENELENKKLISTNFKNHYDYFQKTLNNL